MSASRQTIVETSFSASLFRVATCMEVRRVIQKIRYFLLDSASSDNRGIRQSVFRSHQNGVPQGFVSPFSLLLALPNYPLDQIANLNITSLCR